VRTVALGLAIATAGCSFHAGSIVPIDGEAGDMSIDEPAVDTTPWLASHAYRKRLVVAPGGSAASLTNFPLAVLLDADASLAYHARRDGTDLVVTSSDGTTVLDCELVDYNPQTGRIELWFEAPALQLDSTTAFYLYYGGDAYPAKSTEVWMNGFKGVWHLSSATSMEFDSASSGNHLDQPNSLLIPMPTTGARSKGRGRLFDGSNDYLYVLDLDDSLDVGTLSFSVSLWLRSEGASAPYDTSLYKGGTNGGNPGYAYFNGTSGWAGKILDDSASGDFENPSFASGPIVGQWLHLVMVIDRDTVPNSWTSYVDGVFAASSSFTLGSFSGAAPFQIGASPTQPFHGSLDEVRVYSRALSADWVRTDYDNVAKVDFITLGAEQTKP
jgi:hypothetical protein